MTGRRRRMRFAITLALITLLAAGALTIDRVFVSPGVDTDLHRADAIVVLGGNPYDRFEFGFTLAERGLAPEVVLSNSVGERDARMQELCDRRISGVTVSCFLPQPWTTRGEARELTRLAQERRWTDIIVVTTTAHIERARFILQRCLTLRVQMIDFPERRELGAAVYGWFYQSAGWVRALSQTGC